MKVRYEWTTEMSKCPSHQEVVRKEQEALPGRGMSLKKGSNACFLCREHKGEIFHHLVCIVLLISDNYIKSDN